MHEQFLLSKKITIDELFLGKDPMLLLFIKTLWLGGDGQFQKKNFADGILRKTAQHNGVIKRAFLGRRFLDIVYQHEPTVTVQRKENIATKDSRSSNTI